MTLSRSLPQSPGTGHSGPYQISRCDVKQRDRGKETEAVKHVGQENESYLLPFNYRSHMAPSLPLWAIFTVQVNYLMCESAVGRNL